MWGPQTSSDMQSDNLTLLSGNSQPEPKSAQDTLHLTRSRVKLEVTKASVQGRHIRWVSLLSPLGGLIGLLPGIQSLYNLDTLKVKTLKTLSAENVCGMF